MDSRLHSDITARLDRDYELSKVENGWLRKGKCPQCGQKELYAHAEHPWVVRCGRLEKCGYEGHVKDLYSELFESWSDRYPKAPENPNAAADAYLRDSRGFDLAKIKGWYSQESHWDSRQQIGSATVRFALPGVGYWERIIDRPQRFGKRKATFNGSYGGTWWSAPGADLSKADEIWITEGVFDAIALMHAGITAVSALTCSNYPSAALDALATARPLERPRLVFAFDTGRAGEDFTRKFVRRAIAEGWEATAAQPPVGRSKLDWNDLWQRRELDADHIKAYRYNGALLLASSASEKGQLMYSRHGWASFAFDFERRLYWWKLDIEKLTKIKQEIQEAHPDKPEDEAREEALKQSNTVTEICNCQPVPLYYLKNEVTDEAWYYFRIDFPHDGPSIKNTFMAGQITAAAEFKKRLLHSGAGAMWKGTAGQLDNIATRWLYNIKTVQTIDYIGYSIDHKAYVFPTLGVQGDRVVPINDEDYIGFGKLAIKTLSRSLKLDINPDPKAPYNGWFEKLYTAFGPKGVIALAVWLGSLFADQVRHQFESFPFVEIVGEPGSGKTALLETLWKLVGRNGYEGFDPMKGSQVGFMRTMAQVANLPVVLIESDREDDADGKGRTKQAFHWDSLKSLYNGGSLRTTGVKSSGNDTYDPQFRAALVIAQNAPVQASLPIMERIVHLSFDKSRHTDAGREAALELVRMTAGDMSSFLIRAITQESRVMAMMEERHRLYEKKVADAGSRNPRIQKNHAQVMVFVDALSLACPVTASQQDEAKALLVQLGLERERDIARDHPIVEAFWEAFEYLDNTDDEGFGESRLNHSRSPDWIAINLNHFVQVAAERRQQIPPIADLKRHLKTSRSPRFHDVCAVNSAINGRHNARCGNKEDMRPQTVKCWVFEAPKR